MGTIQRQSAEIDWRDDGVPVSRQFDDPYYAALGGLEESRHVFLAGNALPTRFTAGFHIAEIGFGTGLNMLAVWQAWRESGQKTALRFTSFEAYPLKADDMARALERFPELADLTQDFLAVWEQGKTAFCLDGLEATIIIGDARETLAQMTDPADAWFLDGFAPAKNPELWGAELLGAVATRTKPGGTLATYTAAGQVRRTLRDVGFEVERVSGFGRKRHMTVGTLERKR